METMNTKSDAKGGKPPAPTNRIDELKTEPGIPVYELRFRGSPGAELPLRNRSTSGGINTLRADKGLEITYLPRMQFYRLVETQSEKGAKQIVCFIPREWATFEPLE